MNFNEIVELARKKAEHQANQDLIGMAENIAIDARKRFSGNYQRWFLDDVRVFSEGFERAYIERARRDAEQRIIEALLSLSCPAPSA